MDANSLLLTVIKAEYDRDYTLRITFSNGEVRLVDFTPLMQKGICKKLQDIDYFKAFTLDPFTIELQDIDYFKAFTLDPFTIDWNDEIGFAPEYLYERGVQLN